MSDRVSVVTDAAVEIARERKGFRNIRAEDKAVPFMKERVTGSSFIKHFEGLLDDDVRAEFLKKGNNAQMIMNAVHRRTNG